MNQNDVLDTLHAHFQEIQQRFDVESLAVFGSASRGELRDDSDVDLLVQFNGGATFDGYFALKFYLEDLLGRMVDLATEKMIKPRLRRLIEDELINVA